MIDPMGGPAYWWPFVAGFAIAYLIGSVPFGLILTRLAGAGDVRNIGSGNIGATNVLRTGRKGLAIATLILDLLKGALPVWLAFRYLGPDMAVVAGLGAVLGHCFPVWLKFRGGKGVATAAGVVVALTPTIAAVAIGVFVLVVLATRYVSLASILGALAAAPAAYVMGYVQAAELYLLLALIILAKHAANVRRLAPKPGWSCAAHPIRPEASLALQLTDYRSFSTFARHEAEPVTRPEDRLAAALPLGRGRAADLLQAAGPVRQRGPRARGTAAAGTRSRWRGALAALPAR